MGRFVNYKGGSVNGRPLTSLLDLRARMLRIISACDVRSRPLASPRRALAYVSVSLIFATPGLLAGGAAFMRWRRRVKAEVLDRR